MSARQEKWWTTIAVGIFLMLASCPVLAVLLAQ